MSDVKSELVAETKYQEKIIEFKQVAVNYKERKSFFKTEQYQALKDITFDVFKGETLGVIGRNGAGKSTLLRLLAGIIKPDSGEVIHHTRSVSLMALAAGFDPNLSGRQNAIISGMLIGHSKKEVSTWLEEIKAFSELNDFFEKTVKSYSSGMRARLGFSIAMYTSPDVLLIDEVLGVGDANFRQKAEAAITDKINSDITVVLVSHSEAQIKRLANRVVWIDSQREIKEGEPGYIFGEYNLNLKFSDIGLRFVSYGLDDTFIFNVDCITYKKKCLSFNCILIDKEDKRIDNVFVKYLGNNFYLEGPYGTPRFEREYPKLPYAAIARFEGATIPLNTCIDLFINNENGTIKIASFSVNNNL